MSTLRLIAGAILCVLGAHDWTNVTRQYKFCERCGEARMDGRRCL